MTDPHPTEPKPETGKKVRKPVTLTTMIIWIAVGGIAIYYIARGVVGMVS